jgi:hypothetical protein
MSGWHQLIVLGNGFDLACGLHSKYSDFFENRRPKLEELQADWRSCVAANSLDWSNRSNAVDNTGLTVWDIILFPVSDKDWCDIEQAIKDAVVKITRSDSTSHGVTGASAAYYVENVYRLLQKYQSDRNNHHPYFDEILKNGPVCDPHNLDVSVARYCIAAQGLQHFDSIDKVYDFFLEEVQELQAKFKIYLDAEVNSNTSYEGSASQRIASLYRDESPKETQQDSFQTSVLSFNYTHPTGINNVPSSGDIKWTNIHGTLNGPDRILFGIDGTGNMDDSHVLPFTKTFKLLNLKSPEQNTIIHTKHVGGTDTSTSLIKFYGHSLNEQDYAYFQALFDGVDIYESHTRLIFYYDAYDEISSDVARNSMSQKVTQLINTYSSTMTNEAHGQNLMHKLLLEGRLTIRELAQVK